ncbi:MAG: tail fiber protein [Isosphaeraceae bacterium]
MPLDPFIGQIIMGGFNFAPQGYALCNGQLLPISQNTALFSLLGTMYGGNGTSTFGLPDLRGRVAIGFGQGPGLSNVTQGEQGGTETVTLTSNQIPAHSHSVAGFALRGNQSTPGGAVWARSGTGDTPYAASGGSNMSASAVAPAGGSQPHSNIMPYIVINYVIALQGIYPARP